MTTIETAIPGRRIDIRDTSIGPSLRITNNDTGRSINANLTGDEPHRIAEALSPAAAPTGGQWTRDDFARLDIHPLSPAGEVIDQAVAWLNAHHPKPEPYDQGGVRGADSLLYRAERAERERDEARKALVEKEDEAVSECRRAYRGRDEAVARAEQAERERDEAIRERRQMEDDHAKMCREWRGMDARVVEADRERDAAVARAEQAENARDTAATRAEQLEKKLAKVMSDYQDVEDERDEWKARAEGAERAVAETTKTVADLVRRLGEIRALHADTVATQRRIEARHHAAPAVSRDEIEKAVWTRQGTWKDVVWGRIVEEVTDAVMPLVSGANPAVLVVRESDLPAARVDGDYYVVASAKGDYKWPQHGPSWWADRAQDALAKAARYTSLARLAADRESTVDPVEAQARELAAAGGIDFDEQEPDGVEMLFGMARHVLGQEASDE